jgi:hypothetical protein
VLVTFNPDNHAYKVHGDINKDGKEDVGENIKNVKLSDEDRVLFDFSPGVRDVEGNLVFRPISFASNGNTIIFNSRGQASTSGSIFLIHKNDKKRESNNRLRSINIIQSTGSIESFEFTGEGVWR